MTEQPRVAYFSMEMALDAGMPTYSGGLGVLAGDTVRAAADLGVPMVAVTLLHRAGYFFQHLDEAGVQTEEPVRWSVHDFLEELPVRTSVHIEQRRVHLRAWRYEVTGVGGFVVPVLFLDTDLPENSDWDRTLTSYLYGGDQRYRLCQEVVLGIGGVGMLRALRYDAITRYHMNEGHSSLLTLRLLDESARRAGRNSVNSSDIELVRQSCVFTTHTPVPAGHDQFPMELVESVLGHRDDFIDLKDIYCATVLSHVFRRSKALANMEELYRGSDSLNLTYLALNLSHYINGVAKKHGEVSQLMFGGYAIDAITNGVHATSWVSPAMRRLFDRYVAGWQRDNFSLRYALSIPKEEVWAAHGEAKHELLAYINRESNLGMDVDELTLGFARRATPYKRGDLLIADPERLRGIVQRAGPVQIIYAGKAHPNDAGGKELIQRIFRLKQELRGAVRVAYLPNYDIELARLICGGVDVWVNTPEPPLEASGTSGMKAALNGVPSLSVLDGWWIEGHIEGVTGWSIGEHGVPAEEQDASSHGTLLYDKLESVVLPTFYNERDRFIDVMRHCIALNGSFFNTHRMVQQYVLNAYFR
jgi:glycogen phosphorylase